MSTCKICGKETNGMPFHSCDRSNTEPMPTPRTDEFVKSLIYEIHTNFRLTKAFARQLERELNGFCAELGFTDFQSTGNAILAMIELLELKRKLSILQDQTRRLSERTNDEN